MDPFSARQLRAQGSSMEHRRAFAARVRRQWEIYKETLQSNALKHAKFAKNRRSREGRLPDLEEIREALHPPYPAPDEAHPPRRGFAPQASTASQPPLEPRDPSRTPGEVKTGDGKVHHPERRGWTSGSHGNFGRANAPRDWWLGHEPLSLEERAHLVGSPITERGLGWSIWVCFGCAKGCDTCRKPPGQHCQRECSNRHERCARNNSAALLTWLPSEKKWIWPFTDWPSWNVLPAKFWDAQRERFLVPPLFLHDMSAIRRFAQRPFQPPWVLHIKGGGGPSGTIPVLAHDGRVATGTQTAVVAFCISQNDLANGGARFDAAMEWEDRFSWNRQRVTQKQCLCKGPINPDTGASEGAENCRNICQCSYWLCTGYTTNGERCWSAARHRSAGLEIFY